MRAVLSIDIRDKIYRAEKRSCIPYTVYRCSLHARVYATPVAPYVGRKTGNALYEDIICAALRARNFPKFSNKENNILKIAIEHAIELISPLPPVRPLAFGRSRGRAFPFLSHE